MYNGMVKSHATKNLLIVFANGLGLGWGPFPGPRHDGFMANYVDVDTQLQQKLTYGPHEYTVYCDRGKPIIFLSSLWQLCKKWRVV